MPGQASPQPRTSTMLSPAFSVAIILMPSLAALLPRPRCQDPMPHPGARPARKRSRPHPCSVCRAYTTRARESCESFISGRCHESSLERCPETHTRSPGVPHVPRPPAAHRPGRRTLNSPRGKPFEHPPGSRPPPPPPLRPPRLKRTTTTPKHTSQCMMTLRRARPRRKLPSSTQLDRMVATRFF